MTRILSLCLTSLYDLVEVLFRNCVLVGLSENCFPWRSSRIQFGWSWGMQCLRLRCRRRNSFCDNGGDFVKVQPPWERKPVSVLLHIRTPVSTEADRLHKKDNRWILYYTRIHKVMFPSLFFFNASKVPLLSTVPKVQRINRNLSD